MTVCAYSLSDISVYALVYSVVYGIIYDYMFIL
jgi:hypothetical protein